MRVKNRFTAIAALNLCITTATLAEKTRTITIEASSYQYEAPESMRQSSQLTGFHMAYSMLLTPLTQARGEVTLKEGQGEHQSNDEGSLTGDPLLFDEFRGLLLYSTPFPAFETARWFFGAGRRSLVNDRTGKRSNLNRQGHRRQSLLYYLPLGVELEQAPSWWGLLTLTAEVDFLLQGKQSSLIHLDPAQNQRTEIVNQQKKGMGTRMTVLVEQDFTVFNLGLEIFYHTWSIDRSDDFNVTIDTPEGSETYTFTEDKNKSTEWGIGATVHF